jgi:non-specific serine/threonine protein kinase
LAIELAAARVAVLPPEAMVAFLDRDRRLPLLTGGPGDQPARQRTLRATIAWSYELMPAGARRIFRRFAVFAGGASLDAIAAVCAPDASNAPESWDVLEAAGAAATADEAQGAVPDPGGQGAASGVLAILDDLALLVDHHLVYRVVAPPPHDPAPRVSPAPPAAAAPRFAMLDTVREYALERLAGGEGDGEGDSGAEEAATRRRHAGHYLRLIGAAERGLLGSAQPALLEQLGDEHDNLRAVLTWALTLPGPATALRIAAVLFRFWFIRGHLSEGRRWLDAVLATWPPDMSPPAAALRAAVLSCAGDLAQFQGDDAVARAWYEESLAARRRIGDRRGVVGSLTGLGLLATQRGEYDRATGLYEQALAEARALGDERSTAYVRWNLAFAALSQGDYRRALPLADQSLAALRAVGDTHGIGSVLITLGAAALRHGDRDRARALAREGLGVMRGLGNPRGIADGLRVCAGLAAAAGRPARAARLFGAAQALDKDAGGTAQARGSGAPVSQYLTTGDHEWYERAAHRLASTFAADWAVGAVLSADAAVDLALDKAPPGPAATGPSAPRGHGNAGWPPRDLPPGFHLTAREQEVAALVAEGHRNREIAARLVVTERTAENHVQRLLAKLGLDSRTRLALWAREHLPPPDHPLDVAPTPR